MRIDVHTTNPFAKRVAKHWLCADIVIFAFLSCVWVGLASAEEISCGDDFWVARWTINKWIEEPCSLPKSDEYGREGYPYVKRCRMAHGHYQLIEHMVNFKTEKEAKEFENHAPLDIKNSLSIWKDTNDCD